VSPVRPTSPIPLSELQARLQSASRAERLRLLGRILREARDTDVWRFTTPAEEIFANKLCTLLGRSEIRDLVDVRALEGLGLSLTEALAAGQRKDGGLTPAQLAWVLSQITIGDAATLPGGVPPAELRDYLRDLIERLVRLAHP
jgi:hypothetical protein